MCRLHSQLEPCHFADGSMADVVCMVCSRPRSVAEMAVAVFQAIICAAIMLPVDFAIAGAFACSLSC